MEKADPRAALPVDPIRIDVRLSDTLGERSFYVVF